MNQHIYKWSNLIFIIPPRSRFRNCFNEKGISKNTSHRSPPSGNLPRSLAASASAPAHTKKRQSFDCRFWCARRDLKAAHPSQTCRISACQAVFLHFHPPTTRRRAGEHKPFRFFRKHLLSTILLSVANYFPNNSECVPVRTSVNTRTSFLIRYTNSQSGSIWHSR